MRAFAKKIFRSIKYLPARKSKSISDLYEHVEGEFFRNKKTGENEKLIPNLIIIGAQRSGTTSLYKCLDRHPSIFMSKPVKEPCYFMDVDELRRYRNTSGVIYRSREELLKAFMLQGYSGQQYIGDASTYYTMYDNSKKHNIPHRIFNESPEAKLVYIVRNPFERMVSHYRAQLDRGFTKCSDLNGFIFDNPNAIGNCMYAEQLDQYLKYFSTDKIKLVVFEEFILQPQKVLSSIYSFLGVRDYYHEGPFTSYNSSHVTPSPVDLRLSDENRRRAKELFMEEKRKLESWFGLDLSLWEF